MATVAFSGSQTLFKVGNGASPQVFTTVGEVTSIGAVSVKKGLIDVTHMTSTAHEFIGALSEGQEIEIECNYIPANAQQNALLIAANTVSTAKDFRYVMPSGGSNLTLSFSGLVLGSSIGPTTPDTATKCKFQIKISGSVLGPS